MQSVAESSFDAWIKYYRQDENSPNAIVSYYVKGSLVALCLDLTIRARTRSRRSLDDVMRLMWRRSGVADRRTAARRTHGGHGAGRGRSSRRCWRKPPASTCAGRSHAWAYGTAELPLAQCLRPFGVDGAREADGEALGWLGARTVVRQAEVVIHSAHRDGPAARRGLSAGDRLVAVDGLRCNDATLKAMLARRKPGSEVRVHAFRRDELIETTVTLAAPPPQIALVVAGRNAQRSALARGRRTASGSSGDRRRRSRRSASRKARPRIGGAHERLADQEGVHAACAHQRATSSGRGCRSR